MRRTQEGTGEQAPSNGAAGGGAEGSPLDPDPQGEGNAWAALRDDGRVWASSWVDSLDEEHLDKHDWLLWCEAYLHDLVVRR